MTVSPEDQVAQLERGVVHLVDRAELLARIREKGVLRVKAGFDPTRPDLHLGHTVLMNKMRQFQELGHEVVFVVGDFTARIGDPSGKNVTRKVPTDAEIAEGAKTYAEQAFKILDRDATKVVFNSAWLSAMSFADVIKLAGRYTLARMMERDDFKTRWAEHQSISIHELLYPLAQAQDSVELACDIELGGTDQLFNLLVARDIMRELGMRPQCVMTTPILEGTNARVEDGKLVGDKMSKSLDNYVGVTDSPSSMFEKLMKIDDALVPRYAELLLPSHVFSAREPREAKLELSGAIVTRYHGAEAATTGRENWIAQFTDKSPKTIPVYEGPPGKLVRMPDLPPDVWSKLPIVDHEMAVHPTGEYGLPTALAETGLAKSTSEARRLIESGAVLVDGDPVTDVKHFLKRGHRYVLERPKKRLKVGLMVI